jgi:hypothetical protein
VSEQPEGPDPRYAAAWERWAADLAAELLDQPDRGPTIVVTAPPEVGRPRQTKPRRFFGLVGPSFEDTRPWVELRRVEDHLTGRCIGSAAYGSGFPISTDEDAALTALGWHHPGSGDGAVYVRWWPDDVPQGPYLPAPEAARAARTVAGTMRDVFGVVDPGSLTVARR